jgi:hypothetical protein
MVDKFCLSHEFSEWTLMGVLHREVFLAMHKNGKSVSTRSCMAYWEDHNSGIMLGSYVL